MTLFAQARVQAKVGDLLSLPGPRSSFIDTGRYTYVVVSVDPVLTPYRKRGQDTKIEYYTYGLRQVANFEMTGSKRHEK